MLARDRQTNQFKKVYVKALDSMPVGSEIDFDGQTSDIPVGWEEVTNPDSYSTDEVKTNKVWIDGKPIYRKVITYSNTTTGGRNISTSITNYDYIRVANWDYHSNSYTFGLFGSTQSGDLINVWLSGSSVHFECTPDAFKTGTLYVEIEYTKTTD